MVSKGLVHEHPHIPWQEASAPSLTQLAFCSCDKDHDQKKKNPRAPWQGAGAPPLTQLAFHSCDKDHDQKNPRAPCSPSDPVSFP